MIFENDENLYCVLIQDVVILKEMFKVYSEYLQRNADRRYQKCEEKYVARMAKKGWQVYPIFGLIPLPYYQFKDISIEDATKKFDNNMNLRIHCNNFAPKEVKTAVSVAEDVEEQYEKLKSVTKFQSGEGHKESGYLYFTEDDKEFLERCIRYLHTIYEDFSLDIKEV